MNNRYNSGQNSEQIYQNSVQSYEFRTREVKKIKHGIPRPLKQNQNELSFSKQTNYRILNDYYQAVPTEQYLNNDKYRIKKVIFNDDYIAESYPAPQTDRNNHSKDRVIVYQKKISGDKSYNNNSVHFIKHNSKNINQNYAKIDNKKNNHIFKVSRGFTPKANQNKKLYVNHSSKMLYHIEGKKELKNPREKIFDEEIETTDIINNKTNYKIIDIKHQSNNDLNFNLNMTTPNNTRIHTIIYTNKKDDKLKEIPTPINLFGNTEKKTYRREIFGKERDIPKEINDYFAKNRINYRDRSKYINATLLIQTTFRQYLKKGKIQFNFIKKYVKFYRVINSIQALFNNKKRYWEYFIDKLEKYEVKKHTYTKRKLYNQIPNNKPKNNNEKGKIKIISINNGDIEEEINNYSSKPKTIVRSQSRDVINVEKLIKEKEDLEKRLNQIMEENNMLKKINLSNKELLNKNIELTEKLDKTNQKTKKLEMENEKYLSEFSKTKDKYSKIENEVADVNMKLKMTYLKFLLEKKNKKRIQIINKYFKRYREISLKMKLLEEKKKNENEKRSKYKIVNVLSTAVKKNNEEIMKKRNKLLLEFFYNKDKERTRLLHSCFSKFYYKGMINQFKFRKSIMMDQLKSDSKKQKEEEEERRRKEEDERRKEEERRKREEEERLRLIYEEEQRQKREEEERKMEEERKKREEEEKRRQEEERKKEEEKIEEDKKKNEENTKRINKINMERRRKLKKLLQDEKKQKLDLKREYFKKFHFRCFIFSSHLINKGRESKSSNDNNNIESKNEEEKGEKEEVDLKSKKELEELNKKKLSKLQTIFYKKDRKIIIIKKNILQRWNLIAKLISLGPKKKLRGRSKKRGDSKKRSDSQKDDKKEEEKPKKIKPKIPNIQNLNKKSENDKNSEDEKEKEDEKQNEN